MKLNGDRIAKVVAQAIDADEALSGDGVFTHQIDIGIFKATISGSHTRFLACEYPIGPCTCQPSKYEQEITRD